MRPARTAAQEVPARDGYVSVGLMLAAVFVAASALYAPSIGNQFVHDDHPIVENNPLVQQLALKEIFASDYWAPHRNEGLYRPMTILSLGLNRALLGPGPQTFHVANILLHGAVSCLLALLAFRLARSILGALAAGLLFAVHPVHVEAVSPVVGRSELLAALFTLAALLLGLRAVSGPGSPWRPAAGSALLLLAGLLSKESAICGFLLLCALCVPWPWPGRAGGFERARLTRSAAVVGLASCAVVLWLGLRFTALGFWLFGPHPPSFPANPIAYAGFLEGRAAALAVLGRYVLRLAWPAGYAPDYSFAQIVPSEEAFSGLFWLGATSLLAVPAVLARARRNMPVVMALLVLGLGILPTANLFFPIGTIMAERVLYLPSAGFCLLAAPLLVWAGGRPRLRSLARGFLFAVLALLPACFFALATLERLPDFQDDEAFYTYAARSSPRSALAAYNLGTLRMEQGDPRAAEVELRRALDIYPAYPGAASNLGIVLFRQGRLEEARAALLTAKAQGPESPEPRVNLVSVTLALGNREAAAGRREEARRLYREAAGMGAPAPEAWLNLGLLDARDLGREAALVSFRKSLDQARDQGDLLARIGRAFADAGACEEALPALERSLASGSLSIGGRSSAGVALVTCGRPDLAIPLLDQVLSDRLDDPLAMNNLAHALTSAGLDLPRAVDLARRALELRPDVSAIQDTLVGALLKAGRCPEALAEARALVSRRQPGAGQDEGVFTQSLDLVSRGCP